jgi:hypothetical protein
MKRVGNEIARTLSMAGAGIVRDLKRIYGSPEEAEKAVKEAMKNPREIEEWATLVQNQQQILERNRPSFYFVKGVDLAPGERWTFDHIPPLMREAAMWSMAAAMLVWKAKQEQGVAS